MVGAALFLGDSILTPAISVLSASEGLEVAAPSMSHLVVPLALVILVGVFLLQPVGSGRIGVAYGPVMLVWFLVLGVGGAASVVQDPHVLVALSPTWGVAFLVHHPATGFLTLGAVVLVVTGAEALYTDLGHFGRRAIAVAWWSVVFPALVLAYLGEAAAVLRDPSAAGNPFYGVVAVLGDDPRPGARDPGHDHRLRGGDRRCVHRPAPGRWARLPPGPAHHPHVASASRADLPAGGELDAGGGGPARRRRVP